MEKTEGDLDIGGRTVLNGCCYISTKPFSTVYQKTVLFILSTMRTPKLSPLFRGSKSALHDEKLYSNLNSTKIYTYMNIYRIPLNILLTL